MYKRYILQLLLFLCPLCGKAQDNTSIFPVDWKQIEQTVKTYPDSVKALVTRLTQPEIDTTMTKPEGILAYFGQSYISKGSEMADVMKMNELSKDNPSAALKLAEKVLATNPLNIEALIVKAIILLNNAKTTSANSEELRAKARHCLITTIQIYNIINATGNGTAEQPFRVLYVSDEYNFIHYYLEIEKIEGQSLIMTGENKLPCDLLHLGEKSQNWDKEKIYFDITRVLELER